MRVPPGQRSLLARPLPPDRLHGAAENAARLTLTDGRRFPPERIARFAADLLTAVAGRQ